MDRRKFLKTTSVGFCSVGLAGCGSALNGYNASPLLQKTIVAAVDPSRAALNFLSWDTESNERTSINLLRDPVFIRVTWQGQTYSSLDIDVMRQVRNNRIKYQIPIGPGCEVEWTIGLNPLSIVLSATGAATGEIGAVELVFPWNPGVTPTTILPKQWTGPGQAIMPIVISAPDFGQIVVHSSIAGTGASFKGSRTQVTADLVLELPLLAQGESYELSFAPLYLSPPDGLKDVALWKSVRRPWFNCWQPSATWGDQTSTYSSPGGVLANNVISDQVSFSLAFYADQALWTPSLNSDISVMDSVRHTLDWWLDSRTQSTGQVFGYWSYPTFLDANPSILISAWDYVEATNDLSWLESRIAQLELLCECLAASDVDGDGLFEATQSGNYGTLLPPMRSSNWYDGINFGYKDGYCNAIIYRAWRCMADLEFKLGRIVLQSRYADLADLLKNAYRDTLWNSETGWVACWKSQDGVLHDYASPVVNGLAIEYGLIPAEEGRIVLGMLWEWISRVGFHQFDLGIPSVLVPIKMKDYIPGGFGSPTMADGSDTFQHYENGGITAGQTIHFLAAHYVVGMPEVADKVLLAMIDHQLSVGFQNGVRNSYPMGLDWTTWDGKPCGYEGYLADVFAFLPAVLLREPAFRDRYYRPLRT